MKHFFIKLLTFSVFVTTLSLSMLTGLAKPVAAYTSGPYRGDIWITGPKYTMQKVSFQGYLSKYCQIKCYFPAKVVTVTVSSSATGTNFRRVLTNIPIDPVTGTFSGHFSLNTEGVYYLNIWIGNPATQTNAIRVRQWNDAHNGESVYSFRLTHGALRASGVVLSQTPTSNTMSNVTFKVHVWGFTAGQSRTVQVLLIGKSCFSGVLPLPTYSRSVTVDYFGNARLTQSMKRNCTYVGQARYGDLIIKQYIDGNLSLNSRLFFVK